MITKESLQDNLGWCIDHAQTRLKELDAKPNDGSDKYYYVKRASSLTVILEEIIKKFRTFEALLEENNSEDRDDKKWKDKFDSTLTNMLGFEVKTLDDLDIRPKD